MRPLNEVVPYKWVIAKYDVGKEPFSGGIRLTKGERYRVRKYCKTSEFQSGGSYFIDTDGCSSWLSENFFTPVPIVRLTIEEYQHFLIIANGFLDDVRRGVRHWRLGQCQFNALQELYPDVADALYSTLADPLNATEATDERVLKFHETIQSKPPA